MARIAGCPGPPAGVRVCPVVRPLPESAPSARWRIARTIWRWERSEYGAGQGRAPGVVKGRVGRCAEGLVCAVRDGRLLGCADLKTFTALHYDRLRLGGIVEERLLAHWTARRTGLGGPYRYVASLIVSNDLHRSQPELAHALSIELQHSIWSLIAARGRFLVRVLGISATAVGQAKFRQAGFKAVTRAVDAVDLRPRVERVFPRRSHLPGAGRRVVAAPGAGSRL